MQTFFYNALNFLKSFLGFKREEKPTYWLTRFVFLRLLGMIYFVGFLLLINQGLPLIGESGLLPAQNFMNALEIRHGGKLTGFVQWPTLFWISVSDRMLMGLAWAGAAVSFIVMIGFANVPMMFALWFLYMSFVHVGQAWYGYGWEIQLLETGFLGIFLCPLWDARPFPRSPPPTAVIWLLRWLILRIYIGAGMIKIRGDSCWSDLTCLFYHYETQPIPNPLSPWFHFLPHWFQKFSVAWNHFTQLVVPWFAFGPRPARHIAGLLLCLFQFLLILSGNLSFLSWLTLTATVSCFDDSLLRFILPKRIVDKADAAAKGAESSRFQTGMGWALVALSAWLSVPVLQNVFSRGQIMNTSFNRLHLLNTYGAFGSVGKRRHELIIEGTSDIFITEDSVWKPYEFKAKPGDVNRRPPLLSPYHYRIDWQIWFAAMSTPNRHPWLIHFIWKLMHNDPGALSLIANNPFPDAPPENIRIDLYRYRFRNPLGPEGAYWQRDRLGSWFGPVSIVTPGLEAFIDSRHWKP